MVKRQKWRRGGNLRRRLAWQRPQWLLQEILCGNWDGRRSRVHFFELRLDRQPQLRLDNREIIDARWVPSSELSGIPLTRPVAVFLDRGASR